MLLHAISEKYGFRRIQSSEYPKIIGGRYGLSSKEFTSAMVKGVFDELKKTNQKIILLLV